jgi:hypothetical protein
MNDTTENFFKALANYVEPELTLPSIKLVYDSVTARIKYCVTGETTEPYIDIDYAYWKSDDWYDPSLRVVKGKLIKVDTTAYKVLQLVPGDTWYADKENMLICFGSEQVSGSIGWRRFW